MSDDQPLPIAVEQQPQPTIEQESEPMGALPIGSTTRLPDTPGRWSVWSQSSEAPGAHFLVPFDDEAKAVGAKYLVVRAVVKRDTTTPLLTLIRSDPYIKGLCD